MSGHDEFTVRSLAVAETYELRRRVLRNNDPGATVHTREDDREDAWHVGATSGDGVVAVASFYPIRCPQRPREDGAVQLRFMAVDPAYQDSGVGTTLITAAIDKLRGDGYHLLWANARMTALGFYTRLGFEAVGDTFVEPITGLPHTVIVMPL